MAHPSLIVKNHFYACQLFSLIVKLWVSAKSFLHPALIILLANAIIA